MHLQSEIASKKLAPKRQSAPMLMTVADRPDNTVTSELKVESIHFSERRHSSLPTSAHEFALRLMRSRSKNPLVAIPRKIVRGVVAADVHR